jgi:hypothetical protein
VRGPAVEPPEPAPSVRKRRAWSHRVLRWIVPKVLFGVSYAFEEAMTVPPDASDAEMERLRDELTTHLTRARRTAQAYCERP